MLESRFIDAVISLPLNIFYGAGVPAGIVILRKERPASQRDQMLLIYAARHYRDLSNKNQLRPQDVMRMLVHYHAYGDATKVPTLVVEHSQRIYAQINQREQEEIERLEAEYQEHVERLAKLDATLVKIQTALARQTTKPEQKEAEAALKKLQSQRSKPAAKVAEREERIAEARRGAEHDRQEVAKVGEELVALYNDPNELLKHARVVSLDEIADNEFNLNIPRYVDTFEPEPRMEVKDAMEALGVNMLALQQAETNLRQLLKSIGYEPAESN
jgi:type I restriction enzyme M protein